MAGTPISPRTPRPDNRREALLDAAAALFCRHGFHAASMRDIARAAGMLPGSVYYHFPSKEALLLAVYEEGVARIAASVDAAVAGLDTPAARLEAACVAHLETLLDRSDYAQVVIRVLPADAPTVSADLTALRDAYEGRFRRLIDDLGAPAASRRWLRLLLLGGLNWSQTWYRPDAGPTPAAIARGFLGCLAGLTAPEPSP